MTVGIISFLSNIIWFGNTCCFLLAFLVVFYVPHATSTKAVKEKPQIWPILTSLMGTQGKQYYFHLINEKSLSDHLNKK